MSQDPALPKFEIPISDAKGNTTKNWYFFFQGLLNSITSLGGSGVSQIEAGTNVTISPNTGVGAVTINASGGGGGAGTVTSVATGTGLTGGPITTTGTVALANTAVTPSSYTSANITVNAQGQITAASNGGTTVPGAIPDLTMWWASDNILGATGAIITRLQERTPWMGGWNGTTTAATGPAVIDTTTINSLPILKFVSSNYILADTFTLTGAGTYFIVMEPNQAVTAATQAIIGGSNTSLALYLNSTASVASIGLVKTNIAVIGASTATWASGTAFQANATYNATTGAYAFRQARTAAGSGTGALSAGAGTTSWIGSDSSLGTSPILNSSIGEIIIYNRVLTSTEITNVESYLNTKWGV
jgi:hypothetical protein